MTPCPDDWHDTPDWWAIFKVVCVLSMVVAVCYAFSGVWR